MLEEILGAVFELLMELIFECLIPSFKAETKKEKRKSRSLVAAIVIVPYIAVMSLGALFIYNNPHNARWIMYGITMVVSAALIILVTFLRAKGFKYSLIYSLNFIVILVMTTFIQIDINLFFRSKYYYYELMIISILVGVSSAAYTTARIVKFNKFDKRVYEYIQNGKFKDQRIYEIEKLKISTTEGISAYYNLVNGNFEGVELVKAEIPGTMFLALKHNFKRLGEGNGVNPQDDILLKLYKDNMTRYIYRLAFAELKRKGGN